MKLCLSITTVFSLTILSACSLSADITPPPGYQSPTVEPTLAPATQTPIPSETSTTTMEAATSTGTVAGTMTPGAGTTVTPLASGITITGTVTLNSGANLPTAFSVDLMVYDTAAEQVTQTLTTAVQFDGSYQFTDVPADPSLAYWTTAEYSGVTYKSDPVLYEESQVTYELPIVLYDSTEDLSVLKLDQVHIMFSLSSQNVIQVTELYIGINPGTQTLVISSDGTSIPFIQVPEGAMDPQYQLASGSAPLLSASKGFAFLPGAEKQYGIVNIFTLPYDRNLEFSQPFSLPVSSVTVFVPQGMRLRSDQLTEAGTQDIQGETFLLFVGENLAPGGLTLTLAGTPSDTATQPQSRQTLLLIGIGAVGLLLIGLGIFLFLHDRARLRQEEAAEMGEEDALGNNPESIMDAIIALDEEHKAGRISQEVYEGRRAELKERLRKLV